MDMNKKSKCMICHICGIQIQSTMSSFKRHLKNKHGIVENTESSSHNTVRCLEESCDYSCLKIKQLRSHLESKHQIGQEIEQLNLRNMEEFLKWKESVEIQSNLCFIKHYGKKQNTSYYFCNRSGKKRIIPSEQRKRILKSQGSCKMDSACTSLIIVTEVPNNVKVVYYKTHYGHDIKMAHVGLHKSTKNLIAAQLLQGIPVTDILDKIRDSVDDEFKRIHLITRKDIHNIAQAYSLYDKAIKHANDAISVDMWTNEVLQGPENCIILYKKQGDSCVNEVFLKKEDFLLGIMTKSQIEMLKQFGNNGIICMDATHGTNPYDFNLVSVLVVDDFGEGFPVAFLVCNREDYTVLQYFLSRVKERAGDIEANVFMSDDADQYFTAWSSVMSSKETKKLLCIWHIDRAWRNKINLIKNKEKQGQVYKTLCVLRQEPNIDNFNNYMKSFNTFLQNDPDFTEFKNYFIAHYENRCTMWAACHRIGSSINTNMYLESMHKVLKYIYLNGKTCKRLDKTLHVLLKFVRDKQFERIIKIDKGKITTKISKINKSHKAAVNSGDMVVIKEGFNNWKVHSGSNIYNITAVSPEEEHKCMLQCSLCVTCIHLYSCTCMDFLIYTNMCKHIHKVCIDMKENMQSRDLVEFVSSSICNNESESNNERELHLNTLKKSNTNTILSRIFENINTLRSVNWTSSFDQNVLIKINDHLTSAVNLVSCSGATTSFEVDIKRKCPANKKIDAQLRFHSTKKKRKTLSKLSKPSLDEVQVIKTGLEENYE